MTKPIISTGDVTLSSGRVLSETDLEQAAIDAETITADVAQLRERARTRMGRPSLGEGVSEVVQVRLDQETRDKLAERAAREQRTPSAVVRDAIKAWLQAS